MAFPVVRHQNPLQIGMPLKPYSEQIPVFPLVPVRRGPYRSDGRQHRIVSSQPHFQPQTVRTRNRKQVVVHFKTRFQRKFIDSSNVRKKIKIKKRFGSQIAASPLQVFSRNHDGSLPAKLNHLRDSFAVPHSQSLHYGIFISFLRFHYEFVPGGRRSAIPVERALLPEEYVTSQQNYNVEQHLHKAEHLQLPVNQRPRIQKYGLDVEQNKKQRYHIKLYRNRFARVPCGMDSTFIRLVFLARPFVPPHQSGHHYERPSQAHG